MSNKWGCPKCTISEFFVEVPEDDGKPKFWNSSDKEMTCTFCLKKNENSFENLEQEKKIHLLACLNAPSDLRQELQGGKLLNTAANKLQTKTIKTLQSAKAITLTFNEEGKVIIYDARNISSEHSSMEATIKLVKDLLIEDELKDVKIIAVVIDSSSGYAAACRKLRKELSTIIWLSCFAYQANLCIVDIFKLSQSFFTTIKQAIDTPLQFWKYVEEEAPELAFISKRLFSIVVNLAKNIKKLDSKKLNSMQIYAQKKSSINNMNMNNEVSVNVESSTNQMIKETDSSDEKIESELILNKLDYDEVYEAEDYDLDNTEILHLAEDPQAKWNLNTLFSLTLSNLSSIEL
ncbi:8924_t:CDS:2 [Cetraspora pellucida]|uniref:8924_t:CDS:1 n=1 Tax=Cetraspora pellucida TaxID=1433469 RepID=A0A9N9GKG5_9GLOM|nr:8924_t:CDS:2 [Cetraspora pellucida]